MPPRPLLNGIGAGVPPPISGWTKTCARCRVPLLYPPASSQASSSSQHDSISGLHDLSLRMSMDGHFWGGGSFKGGTADLHALLRRNEMAAQAKAQAAAAAAAASGSPPGDALLENDPAALGMNRAASSSLFSFSKLSVSGPEPPQDVGLSLSHTDEPHGMRLRGRRQLLVLALDEYDVAGQPGPAMGAVLRALVTQLETEQQKQADLLKRMGMANVLGASGGASGGSVGIAIATALSVLELLAYLRQMGVPLRCIDVAITGSGSAVYYSIPCPPTPPDGVGSPQAKAPALEDGKGWQLVADPDYFRHIEYRWSAEPVRQSIARLISSSSAQFPSTASLAPNLALAGRGGAEAHGNALRALMEDEIHSTSRCLAYRVLQPEKMPSLSILRKKLRMRGLRLHLVYCRAASSLHILPLHASRAQALRYLFVRWRLNVANMSLLLSHSPSSDSDAPQLFSGTHRTVLLKGLPSAGPLGDARLELLDCKGALGKAEALIPNLTALDVEAEGDTIWAKIMGESQR